MNKQPKATQMMGNNGERESPIVSHRLIALLEIPRPFNCAITFLSVLLGGWLGPLQISAHLLLAALSAALITGGGNVLNDLCGVTEDQINKPQRPLPSGRTSRTSATALTVLLLLSGLTIGFSLPISAFLIALTAVIVLISYNFWLKRIPILGNLSVSTLGGLAFLYGGFAAQAYQPALWPAAFATLFHLGREILKDLEDIIGDRILSGSTIPLSWGRSLTRTLITFIFSTLIILTPFPALIDTYGNVYLAIVSLLNLSLIYVLIRLWRTDKPETLSHLSHILKAGMLLGLFAFFFDRLAP
ncbi:MAG: geranylgeranylglycerol-phosphate geranylgeranyltransferase [Candidatus Latescibacteria bacterium]|nr:geranylgeranylglycerol-phosphate geranylgeranyltransferase [Candidatus Latescibacterota bacterium]MBT4139414.1 geranylgeranylglycerol-phosphate geranylgeranyltransferase [Candidatus Latescibacterota bacterium]MBT5831622.1 geranylgeranylglycerol-phosphate geranylgeranyltransferase [Candidatus Latescibacterota bacterium]